MAVNLIIWVLVLMEYWVKTEGCYSRLPLGFSNGLIRDSQMVASSAFRDDESFWQSYQGRLRSGQSWCGNKRGDPKWREDYLQINFGELVVVTGVAIQGDPTWSPNYALSFYLQISNSTDKSFVDFRKSSPSGVQNFTGNRNNTHIKYNWFSNPPSAKSVRFRAAEIQRKDKSSHVCVRMELYGCYVSSKGSGQMVGTLGIYPLGMESGTIPDKQITASATSWGSSTSYARLNSQNSWCTGKGGDVWLDIDLGHTLNVVGISLQGQRRRVDENFITEYQIEYTDGTDPTTYRFIQDKKGDDVVFKGNSEPGSNAVYQRFPENLLARRIRLVPVTATAGSSKYCVRMEIFGGHPVCSQDLTGIIKKSEKRRYNIGSMYSWCSSSSEYLLKIDLKRQVVVSGVAIAGDSEEDSWLQTYVLSYYDKNTGSPKEMQFTGTIGRADVAVSWLDQMAISNSVTIRPRLINGKACTRYRIIGCREIISEPRSFNATPTADEVILTWKHPISAPLGRTKYKLYIKDAKGDYDWATEIPSNSTSYRFEKLSAATEFSVQLVAYYKTYNREASLTVYTLPKAPPIPVVKASKNFENLKQTTTLSFSGVSDVNGPISHYEVIIATKKLNMSLVNSSNLLTQAEASDRKLPYFLAAKYARKELPSTLIVTSGVMELGNKPDVTLPTFGTFHFYFRAVIVGKDVQMFDPQMRTYYSEASVVDVERKSLLPLPSDKPVVTQTTAQINLTVQDIPNARYYHIIVVDVADDVSKLHPPHTYKPNSMKTYDTAEKGDLYIAAYITTKELHMFRHFVLGDGLKSSNMPALFSANQGYQNYRNGPLVAGHTYAVFQRVYDDKGNYFSTPWLQPFTTDVHKETRKGTSSGTKIAAVVVPIVLLIILAVLGVAIYWFRLQKKPEMEYANDHPMSYYQNVDDELNKMNTSYQVSGEKETNGNSEVHVPLQPRPSRAYIVPQDPKFTAIPVGSLPKYVAEGKKDSRHGFTEEFKSIPFGQEFAWEEGQKSHNKGKNRYNNIAAYDHSRVMLPMVNEIHGSDYINANYIHGYTVEKEYVAAQGPKPETVVDFWRMVWELRPLGIVMLTNLTEKGKRKCEQYWPKSGSQMYGDVMVTLEDIDKYADYTIRSFTVQKSSSNSTHVVTQFHFLSWPDHGAPEYPTSLLSFCRKFRTILPRKVCHNPIIVHCSAGVGRTGTFIVIDTMLQLIKEKKMIDVYNYLKFIRMNRVQMVQTEDQYVFIYEALLDFVACGITEFTVAELMRQVETLRTQDPTTETTGYENQFKRLGIITPRLHDNESRQAHKKCNRSKNRSIDIVPKDQDRVILAHNAGLDGSDYINAVFVHGFKEQNAFIATQSPLKNTIEDFWRMVHHCNVTSIIMLNSTQEGDEDFPVYWPADTELTFHSLKVKLKEMKVIRDVVVRTITMHHKKEQSSRIVHQYQITTWRPTSVPNVDTIIEVLRLVEHSQQSLGNGTICVHCSDGTDRTGTFIASSIVLERLKVEQLIDVFQTVKAIRLVRPGFVATQEHYEFIHDLALKFVDSFSTYANF